MLRSLGDIAQSICSLNNELFYEAAAKERTGVADIEDLVKDERDAIYQELNNDKQWQQNTPFLTAELLYDREKVTSIAIKAINHGEWISITECARQDKIWYVTGEEIHSGCGIPSMTFEEINLWGVAPLITYAFTKLDIDTWPVWDFTKGEAIE